MYQFTIPRVELSGFHRPLEGSQFFLLFGKWRRNHWKRREWNDWQKFLANKFFCENNILKDFFLGTRLILFLLLLEGGGG